MVLLQLQEVEDVGVPGFQVDSERTLTLTTSLVDVPGGIIEHLEHRDESVTVAVGTLDIGVLSADIADRDPNTSGTLGDQSTLLQSVVDPVDGVGLHLEKEATRHLGLGGA